MVHQEGEQCLTRSGSAYGARARDTMAVPAGPAGDGDGVETDDDGIADDDVDDRAALGQPPEPPADVSPALVGYGQSGKGPLEAQPGALRREPSLRIRNAKAKEAAQAEAAQAEAAEVARSSSTSATRSNTAPAAPGG